MHYWYTFKTLPFQRFFFFNDSVGKSCKATLRGEGQHDLHYPRHMSETAVLADIGHKNFDAHSVIAEL